MWRAALPCRHVGVALLGSIVATALVVGASPSSSAAASAAPAGQVWALALPASAKTVQQKQTELARSPRRHHDRRLQASAGVPQAACSLGQEVGPGRDRTEAGCSEEGVQVRCRPTRDLRGRRRYPGGRGPPRPPRPRRLRRHPGEDAPAAADASRQPRQALAHPRPAAAEPEGSGPERLALRYRLRRRRSGARSGSHFGSRRRRSRSAGISRRSRARERPPQPDRALLPPCS